ncbi:hypothetical protein E2320_008210, partial [Naja naja]
MQFNSHLYEALATNLQETLGKERVVFTHSIISSGLVHPLLAYKVQKRPRTHLPLKRKKRNNVQAELLSCNEVLHGCGEMALDFVDSAHDLLAILNGTHTHGSKARLAVRMELIVSNPRAACVLQLSAKLIQSHNQRSVSFQSCELAVPNSEIRLHCGFLLLKMPDLMPGPDPKYNTGMSLEQTNTHVTAIVVEGSLFNPKCPPLGLRISDYKTRNCTLLQALFPSLLTVLPNKAKQEENSDWAKVVDFDTWHRHFDFFPSLSPKH